jgi:hypothetical protein
MHALMPNCLVFSLWKKPSHSLFLDYVGSAPQDLQVGSDVEFVLNNKVVARGVIDTIRGRFGNATKWSKILIGSGKALITIKDVVVPGTRPTFGYTDPNNDDLSWDEKEVCLGDLRDRYQNAKTDLLLAMNTLALRISVSDDDTPIELSTEEIYVETSRSESPIIPVPKRTLLLRGSLVM